MDLETDFQPKSVLRQNSPRSTHALLYLSHNQLVEHNGKRRNEMAVEGEDCD